MQFAQNINNYLYKEGEWTRGLSIPMRYIGICDMIFYSISYKIVDILWYLKITPNMVTFFGLSCQLSACYFINIQSFHFIWVIMLAILSDTADGYLARYHNCGTKYGTIIDHTSDWIGGLSLIFTFLYNFQNIVAYITFSGVIVIEYYNFSYCGYIQKYLGGTDVLFSRILQKTISNVEDADRKTVENEMFRLREMNSSFAGLYVIIILCINVYYMKL